MGEEELEKVFDSSKFVESPIEIEKDFNTIYFKKIINAKTTWNGVVSVYQSFCKSKNKLMILVTKTFPSDKELWSLCPQTAKKKFVRLSNIMTSEEFVDMKREGW